MKDAESAYLRAVHVASNSVWADTLQPAIGALLEEQARDECSWAPGFTRGWLVRIWSWSHLTLTAWVLGFVLILGYALRRASRWRRELRIGAFARVMPGATVLDPERMIEHMLLLAREVGAPMVFPGVSGQRLPVLSTASPDKLLPFAELASQLKWLPKLINWVLRFLDRPRFVVSGHVEGTLTRIRFVAYLRERGRSAGTWDRIALADVALEEESNLACEIVHRLSELMT